MNGLRMFGLIVVLVALVGVFGAGTAAALPASEWWLVVHNQCDDTLHWINAAGEFTSIARPALPDEVPGAPCSYKALHISQDGRYLVQTGQLNSGRVGVGFYDLQAGAWLQVHQAQPDELIYLGERYSSDSTNRIAVGFANAPSAARAWRVIVFDMATGDALEELRSDGPEIASFVGGEFLATAATIPQVLLLAEDSPGDPLGAYHVRLRFDALDPGMDPLGAVAWYPSGAPGVVQELISSPYDATDIDLLPTRDAIYAYNEAAFPAVPEVGIAPYTINTNAAGMLRPTGPGDISPTPQVFYADGVNTVYGAQWAEDGAVALFRLNDGSTERVHWVRVGTAVLMPMDTGITQVLGVPTGFVFSTADGVYFQDTSAPAPPTLAFSDPMFSSSAALVWATAYGDPPLVLDTPAGESVPGGAIATPAPASGGPDLFVSEFSLNPATPVQGAAVEVRVGVYNQGDMAVTTPFRIEWYPGESYPSPACDWTLDSMNAGGGRILTCTYAGYPSPYSTINTKVLVDTLNAVSESNEANNGYTQALSVTGSAPTAQPDLFVSEFSLTPATPVQGQPVEVRVGVYNGGGAAVTSGFDVLWYPGEGYASPACDWNVDSLAASGGRILTCTYAGYPSHYASINTKVLVDTANAITESNEANNGYTLGISVTAAAPPAQPDLFVSEFSLSPATPVKGQPVEVRVGVYNQGTAAVSGSFRIEWYPGENYPSPACDWTLDSMNAGGGRILTCTYAGYPSPYGSINTKVLVDTTNAISESNESNNGYTQAVTVNAPPEPAGQPDLYVSEFSLNPATPVKGQAVQVRVGVYNQGTAAASGSFRVVWYPGENYPSPACDWTLDGLVARGGRILTCTYAGYPSPYGSINTKVIVDTANAISESNEGNNTYLQGISVSSP